MTSFPTWDSPTVSNAVPCSACRCWTSAGLTSSLRPSSDSAVSVKRSTPGWTSTRGTSPSSTANGAPVGRPSWSPPSSTTAASVPGRHHARSIGVCNRFQNRSGTAVLGLCWLEPVPNCGTDSSGAGIKKNYNTNVLSVQASTATLLINKCVITWQMSSLLLILWSSSM